MPIAASFSVLGVGSGMAGDTTAMQPAEADDGELERLLAPLREDPQRSAILTDVDGTIAPIVLNPTDAAVPEPTRELLRALAERYALVGCLSGRRALDARRIVGLDELAYSGNHGFELLLPGDKEVRPDPSLDGHEGDAPSFVGALDRSELRAGRGSGPRTRERSSPCTGEGPRTRARPSPSLTRSPARPSGRASSRTTGARCWRSARTSR